MGRKKQEKISVEGFDGKTKHYLLPNGVRAVDLMNLSNQDIDVLAELKVNGRRTRYFFEKRGLMDAVRRLKSRGLVEAVRLKNNYAYDLTRFGYFAFEHQMI